MQEKFDDVASVKDSRAKGDGATDDTAAINPALLQLFTPATNTLKYVEPPFFPRHICCYRCY